MFGISVFLLLCEIPAVNMIETNCPSSEARRGEDVFVRESWLVVCGFTLGDNPSEFQLSAALFENAQPPFVCQHISTRSLLLCFTTNKVRAAALPQLMAEQQPPAEVNI